MFSCSEAKIRREKGNRILTKPSRSETEPLRRPVRDEVEPEEKRRRHRMNRNESTTTPSRTSERNRILPALLCQRRKTKKE